ncbi:MAG: very short patch repair endonuclease [Acidobacteriia bacterium]|nr:very short patch repair endonuclease [Terriglobia bacterium]
MADRISKQKRSWNMSRIRGRNTKPELIVRSLLRRMGFRYRLHVRALPGCPDIVLHKYKIVLLVHGCFWHRHGCKSTATPKTNTRFWQTKFDSNVARDAKVTKQLRAGGWRVLTIWACKAKDEVKLTKQLERFFAKTTHTDI